MTAAAPLPRRELPYGWKAVKEGLQGRIRPLLDRLGFARFPVCNGLCLPLNPRRKDRNPGSFVIWCHGDAVGGWKDYAIGRQGDVFELIAYVEGLQERMDAYWWALDFLGWGRGRVRTATDAEQERRRYEDERQAAEAKKRQDDDAKSRRLFEHWLKLAPTIAGTLAERYLVEGRGIDLARLAHFPKALRFSPEAEHVDEETGEVTVWPAMVAAMTRGNQVVALHRTFLTPDGLAKAPVKPAKKMYGPARGSAVRLAPGAAGLSPGKAEAQGVREPLIVGEGIETTLSAAMAQPSYRAWAGGSLAGMLRLEWPACASAVVLLRDNDTLAQTAEAFERVAAAWAAQAAGRPLKVVRAAVGKDFNDWVKETK